MTTYRAGQRVRVEWPDGTAVEGYLQKDACVVKYADRHYSDTVVAERDGATITILSEPRPDEPQGLGAVVEASASDVGDGARLTWVRARTERNEWRPSTEVYCDNSGFYRAWADLVNPVVLHEGWTL